MAIIGKVAEPVHQLGLGREAAINDLLIEERYAVLSKQEGTQFFSARAAIALYSFTLMYLRNDLKKSLLEYLNGSKGMLSADGEARREELLKKDRFSWTVVDQVDAVLLAGIISKKIGAFKKSVVNLEEKLSNLQDKLKAKREQLRSGSSSSQEAVEDFSPSKPSKSRKSK